MVAEAPGSSWVHLTDFGDMDLGAPAPLLLLGEHRAALSYYLNDTPGDWDGTTVHMRDAQIDVAPMALVEFDRVAEARSFRTTSHHGHPDLPGVFESVVEVLRSDWAKQAGEDYRHLVFAFHDTVVEVLCRSYKVFFFKSSSVGLMPRMSAYVFS